MTLIPTLTTDRLTLRAPTLDDLQAYVDFYAVSPTTVGKYGGPRSNTDVLAILKDDIAHWTKGYGMWLLQNADGVIVGGCGLVHPNDWPRHELTWWLMPDQTGHGYATEASHAAINFGYEVLGWPVVETHMRDDNTSARALAGRLGAQKITRMEFPDGVSRDVFALPANQPQIGARSA